MFMLSKIDNPSFSSQNICLKTKNNINLNNLTLVSYCEFFYFLNIFRVNNEFIKLSNNIDFLLNSFDKSSVFENKKFYLKYKNYKLIVPTKYFIKNDEFTIVILNKHILPENYALISLCLFIENNIPLDGIYYFNNNEKYRSLDGFTNLDKDFSNINPNILSNLIYCIDKLKRNKNSNKINSKSKGFHFKEIETSKILDNLIATLNKQEFKKERSNKCEHCILKNKCNTFLENETFSLYQRKR